MWMGRKQTGAPDAQPKPLPIRAVTAISPRFRAFWRAALASLLFALLSATCTAPAALAADTSPVGPVTGLRLPRYVSLRYDKTNVREGPSKTHRTAWIFQRASLPVEITAEFDTWRRIRDSEGSEGWVLQSLLSGRRTALVAPWKKTDVLPLYAKPDGVTVVAKLQAGVLANVKTCDRTWCAVFGDGFEGFIRQSDLWGVYPDETL
jgi:SH3-like domain-containing protein